MSTRQHSGVTTGPRRVLIAAPARVIRELGGLFLDDAVEVVGAQTWDEALSALDSAKPDLLIVCYAFDEARPFRLFQHLRSDRRKAHLPTILVRSLPVRLGATQAAAIRTSYETLGVDEFFNLHDEKARQGADAALRQFRESVLNRLPRQAAPDPKKGSEQFTDN